MVQQTQEHANSQGQESLEQLQQHAEQLERELRELKEEQSRSRDAGGARVRVAVEERTGPENGIEILRRDAMMAHLLDALDAGKDIGHYGRLVFTMVASHFLSDDEVMNWLTKDHDVDRDKAAVLLRQVEARDYNPPRRERILDWQRQQEFPILPSPDDPDCGNVYKSLKFPEEVYEHIQQYQTQKVEASEEAA